MPSAAGTPCMVMIWSGRTENLLLKSGTTSELKEVEGEEEVLAAEALPDREEPCEHV